MCCLSRRTQLSSGSRPLASPTDALRRYQTAPCVTGAHAPGTALVAIVPPLAHLLATSPLLTHRYDPSCGAESSLGGADGEPRAPQAGQPFAAHARTLARHANLQYSGGGSHGAIVGVRPIRSRASERSVVGGWLTSLGVRILPTESSRWLSVQCALLVATALASGCVGGYRLRARWQVRPSPSSSPLTFEMSESSPCVRNSSSTNLLLPTLSKNAQAFRTRERLPPLVPQRPAVVSPCVSPGIIESLRGYETVP